MIVAMKHLGAAAAVCALPISVVAESPALLAREVDEKLPALQTVYEALHARPELSYQEEATSRRLATRMRELGFTVTERVGEYGDPERTSYGVVAVLENGDGPTILVRTDLDGLPVEEQTGLPHASRATGTADGGETVPVMHACGHDLHMSVWLGTAEMLAGRLDAWSGKLVMIAQPAEERGAGARAMLDSGLYATFGTPDAAIALHDDAGMPAGHVGIVPGYALANVDSVDVTVRGVGGHGAYPHTTKDPVVLAARIVVALQTLVSREISPLDPAVVTVGSIHGGTKHNVISNEVRLQLTVRSYKPEVRRALLDGIRRIADGIAASAGLPPEMWPVVTVAVDEYTPTTYNDPDLTARLVASFRHWLGPESVVDKDPVMGGEDFGRFALEDRSVPIAMFWLGAVAPDVYAASRRDGTALPSLHSPVFAPDAERALRTGVIALTGAVLDLMVTGDDVE